MWPDGRPEKLDKLIKERGDKKVLEAVKKELVGRLLGEIGAELGYLSEAEWQRYLEEVNSLFLRGNIVDGKFVQDEKGQYQVCVVDLKGALPTEISSYFPKMGKRFQEEMLKAGYHRIVGG